MRRHLAIAAMLPVLVSSLACVRAGRPTSWQDTKKFPATADKLVRVQVRSLDVVARVVPDGEVTVTTRLEARSSTRGATTRWIQENTPVFDDSPGQLEIRMPRRERSIHIFGFFYSKGTIELTIPAGCRLEVETSSGDVELVGPAALAGAVRVHTRSGDVEVQGGARELIVESSSGDLRVRRGELAALQVDTSSGNVRVDVPCARALIDATSGDLRLGSLTGGLSARTSSGSVTATWTRLAAGEKVDVRTSSGDVTLRMPADVVLSGDVRSKSGSIRAGGEGRSQRRDRELLFEGQGPAVELHVATSSGGVSIIR